MRQKSGIETLLEILNAPISDGDDAGRPGGNSTSSAGGAPGSGNAGGGRDTRGERGGRGASINIDLSSLESINGPKSKKGLFALIIVVLLLLAGAYWWYHPPISINSGDTWMFAIVTIIVLLFLIFIASKTGKKAPAKGEVEVIDIDGKPVKGRGMSTQTFKKLLLIPGALAACAVLGWVLSLSFIPGNAEKYATVLKTDTLEFAEDIHEVNYSEIPVIDRDSAILLGNREMGSIPEYVSQFEVSSLYSQINYHGEPVRVSPLNYADLFKWFTNRTGGIPAYALVNMTTQDAEIVRLGDSPIHYSNSEPLVRNIDRHVQLKYPFYMFDQKSFEIDENGHPWWIFPVKQFTIGLFGGETISRVVLCDATTGETQDLAIGDCPQWVDRVFPAELLIKQYNWSGAYKNGWINSFLGQEGVVRTTPGTDGTLGYNYIAKDDDVWVYTGVTSATADNSIVGFVLINQRTQESHFYSVSGATEDSAMSSAEGQVQNLRYTATFPLLINVANQPTYFMALKDGAGLVKKFAMVDIQRYQNVAVGDTVADTQKSYKTLLATNGVHTDAAGTSDLKLATGVINTITQAVIDGNSHFYVTLKGIRGMYDFALPNLVEIVAFREGDSIQFTFIESPDTQIHTAYSFKVSAEDVKNAAGEQGASGEALGSTLQAKLPAFQTVDSSQTKRADA